MIRDGLEKSGSCFNFDKIKAAFTSAEAEMAARALEFLNKKAAGTGLKPYRAAQLLADQGADALTVLGGLLFPLLQQGLTDREEICGHFGQSAEQLLRDLKSPYMVRDGACRYRREDVRALLASLGGSPRKALLLIVFRLLELEEPSGQSRAELRRLAKETIDFYVPIANRLSLGKLRHRLEDACFYILAPSEYEQLKQKVAPIREEDNRCLEILLEGVEKLLEMNGIKGRLQGRTKSLYGIRCKINRTGKSPEEIMDRIGLRVIVPSVPECYTVLGVLHSHFKPIPGTFDDYIGLPKDNGYQSLHTCVYPVREISHKPIEFQVRTELMHIEAEHGTAAHWRYKNSIRSEEKDQRDARWIEALVEQHENADSAEAFVDLLHRQVFMDHLVVFGKGGRIIRLPENSTVRDYLNKCRVNVPENPVIKVNGQIVDPGLRLRDGDSIEIVDPGSAGDRKPAPGGEEDLFPEDGQIPLHRNSSAAGQPDAVACYGKFQEKPNV